ncbi:MAG: Na+/H+ antiporter NhaC family protein [Bacillota bacterium]|nr:Na+/H+ antiporter NhaC family protein [Bacillota bacterium]
MDLIAAFSVFTIVLVFCISRNVTILLPLLVGLFCFTLLGLHRGFKLKALLLMMKNGVFKSLIVLRIFILIGLITALWRACGTIPFLVYYGVGFITPSTFVLFAFVISSMLSFAMGTSFGVASTVGVVLMTLARSGGADVNIVAGAVISGAYFGDRCAPTSSSANLVAALTGTKLQKNIRVMLVNAFIPFLLSAFVYFLLSKIHPLSTVNNAFLNEIPAHFNLSAWALIPVVLVLALPLLKCGIQTAMLSSIVSAAILCFFLQKLSLYDVFTASVFGYKMASSGPFAQSIAGGGLLTMVKVSLIIIISSTYSGIFDGTGLLRDLQAAVSRLSGKIGQFPATVLTSVVTAVCFCNQTLCIIMTNQLMSQVYEEKNKSKAKLASDLEDSSVLIAALIPWNTAIVVPMGTLSVDFRAIPFAVFLYLVPLVCLFTKPVTDKYLGVRLK